MADLHRLIVWLCLCAASALPQAAHAAFPATRTNPDACTVAPCNLYTTRSPQVDGPVSPYLAVKADACTRAHGWYSAYNPTISYTIAATEPSCTFTHVYSGSTFYTYLGYFTQGIDPVAPTYSCPANSTLSGSTCTCAVGYTESAGTCVPPAPVNNCSDLTGQSAGRWDIEGATSGPKQICDTGLASGDSSAPGCMLSGTPDFCAKRGNVWHCSVQMKATGGKCTPDPSGTTDVPGTGDAPAPDRGEDNSPSKCPAGKVPGTVNGTQVCVDPGQSDTTKTTSGGTTTTTNPDGSTTSTETTKTTECNGATCTTTTTTTTTNTPAGGGTSTTETTSTTGTCTAGSPGCGDRESEPSRFGGSCAAFACDGDAIMCAVALEQHKRNCQLFVDSSAESALYDAEKGKTGPQYTSESVTLSSGSFSQANALGATAQCIQDRTVTVAGHSVVLPFSQVCSTLQHLGTVLMFISFLVAYRIVARG